MKTIDVRDEVRYREIWFNKRMFPLYTNMFAEHPTQLLKIPDDHQLVGFAVAVDDNGTPSWLDFIVGGEKW